jgi:phosphate acyltransferase
VRIVVDAMGGDNAPYAIVNGCVNAVNEQNGFDITLVGKEEEITKILAKREYDKNRITIINALEVISSEDVPTKAVKEKKNSSMVVGVQILKRKEGDVFLSAGNTGALMAVSLLNLGRIRGVDRPALSFFFPAKTGPVLIIDVGVNLVCKPENYLQFGIMGSIYMSELFGIDKPRVAIINVGAEEQKGSETIKQAYSLLNSSKLNFTGNIEGREIPGGFADVVVCDGFLGNVLLKFSEGVADFFTQSLKSIYVSSILTKLSFVFVKKRFKKFYKSIDYKEYGGTPLLGINGKVIKAHGSSNEKAIKNAVIYAFSFGKSNVVGMIEEQFKNMGVEEHGEQN